jgi:hypothetical protein
MSDKLLINFWGASISADGTLAIAAAVIVMLTLLLRRPSQ